MVRKRNWKAFFWPVFLQTTVEKALENWPSILALLATVGGMTWLSTTHEFVQAHAPFSYGVIILLAALIYAAIRALLSFSRSRSALADFESRRAKATGINPLKNIFTQDKIKVTDFYHEFYRAKEFARFEECEFYGPGAILFDGGNIDVFHTENCEFVGVALAVMQMGNLYSAAHFKNCTFTKCRFYRVMFISSKEQIAEMKMKALENGKELNIICS